MLILSEIPFLITLVSYDVSETARVRSSGVATPTRDGIPPTNITSIASTCSVWTSEDPTVVSAAVVRHFMAFPFSEAMSVPQMASATLKS